MNAGGAWAGIDVGGRRKGFHCAVVQGDRCAELACRRTASEVVDLIERHRPTLTAIDCPRSLALDGQRSRRCEREFVRAGICNIRFTPDRAGLDSNPSYYEWIAQGLELYQECQGRGLCVIECFPTASWTVWAGSRGSRRRSSWTTDALAAQNLRDVPKRTNQDNRDAICAALTARAHHAGRSQSFGEVVVATR